MSVPNNTLMTQYGGAEFSITHTGKDTVTIFFREYARGGSVWTVLDKADARAMAEMLSRAAKEEKK